MKKIMIIDDEPQIRKILSDRLKLEKFEVIEAEDGQEGLEKTLDSHPDLVLLDVDMPKMNGFLVGEAIKKDEWGKTVPILYLTNIIPNDKEMKRLSESEPAHYLIKTDWSLDELTQKVKDVLTKK